jgi:hypothetical protein
MEAVEQQGSAPEACEVCVACSWRRLGFPSLNRHSGGRFREPTKLGANMPITPSQMLFCSMKRI